MTLLTNPVSLFLVIVVIGHLIGKVKIKSFSLGSSSVLFAAIAFGHFGYVLPAHFRMLGLVLFIYAIGLQAGPGFVSSLKQNGLTLSMGALSIVAGALCMSLVCSWIFDFDHGITTGLFAGAMTSTPGLAVAAETITDGSATAAYGVTYIFGVIVIILFIKLLPRLTRIDIPAEELALENALAAQHPPINFRHLEITNANLFGMQVQDIFLEQMSGVTITRLLRKNGDGPILVNGDTVLKAGDRIRLVGHDTDLEKAQLYLGRESGQEIKFESLLISKRIIVTNTKIVGKTLGSLSFRAVYDVQVARITRNGFDIPAKAGLRLNMGDLFHVVGRKESVKNVQKQLGNDIETLYTANMISILTGILIGVLFGMIPIPLPGGGGFNLGITGGVLTAGLVFGHVKKTGPMVWHVPTTTNAFIRELGLLLFLAVVGTSAGATIVATISNHGMPLVISGLVVTLLPMVGAYTLCRRTLKIEFLRTIGVLTGGMTSTPGLAAGTSISKTQYAATAYATVYPMALIGMILATRVLIWTLGTI